MVFSNFSHFPSSLSLDKSFIIIFFYHSSFLQSRVMVRRKRGRKSRVRKYICEYCDKKYTCSSHLKRHRMDHTGERPFKCPHDPCPFAAKERHELKRHIRIHHTGEKPFKCPHPGCDYSSSTSSGVSQHKKRHSN
jgi:uncharacterized Zn-finger protein